VVTDLVTVIHGSSAGILLEVMVIVDFATRRFITKFA